MSGVKTNHRAHTATVTFDDEKTGVDEMLKALEEGGYPVQGKPEFLS